MKLQALIEIIYKAIFIKVLRFNKGPFNSEVRQIIKILSSQKMAASFMVIFAKKAIKRSYYAKRLPPSDL